MCAVDSCLECGMLLLAWQALQMESILGLFSFTGRYIDDLLSLNNPFFSRLIYRSQQLEYLQGVYPEGVGPTGLRVTQQPAAPGRGLPYMDLCFLAALGLKP